MSDDRIPGTRVPDTPIHRASMWLEDLKYGERRLGDAPLPMEVTEDELYELLIRELELDVTVEQLLEAADYYGTNLAVMLHGAFQIVVQTPDGRTISGASMFISAWLDGWMHGAVTQKGLRGRSVREMLDGR